MTDLPLILLNGIWAFALALALAVISFSGYVAFSAKSPQSLDAELAASDGRAQGLARDIKPWALSMGQASWRQTGAIANRIVSLELLWLALLFPSLFFPATPVVLALLVLPALWVLRFLARGRIVPRTPFDWSIFALLLTVLVSTLAFGDIVSQSHVASILFGVGLYYAIVEWVTSDTTGNRLKQTIVAFACAGGLLTPIALFGTHWISEKILLIYKITRKLPSLTSQVEGRETGFNPNEVAGSLLWILPVVLAVMVWLWVSARSPKSEELEVNFGPWTLDFGQALPRLGVSMIVVACGVILLLTQSRSAVIGLAFGLALLVWLGIPRIRTLLTSLFLIATFLGVFVGPERIVDTVIERLTGHASVRNALDLETLESRTLIWSHSLAGIQDFALTGIGLGTYQKVMPVLYPTNDESLDNTIYHAHNILLQAAIEGGLLGLAAYLSIWIVAAVAFLKVWVESSGWAKACAAGIGAALLSYFVYGFTDVVPLGAWFSLYFWALLALLASLVQSSRFKVQSRP